MPRQPVTLQRRHFELVAKTIRELPATCTREEIARAFVAALKPTNPQFRSDQFRDACTPEPRQ